METREEIFEQKEETFIAWACDTFNIIPDIADWQPILCPIHKDRNKSAGIIFEGKSGVFNCLAGCGSMSLDRLYYKLHGVPDSEFVSRLEKHEKAVYRQSSNISSAIDTFTNWLLERKLDIEFLKAINAEFITDKNDDLFGFLVVHYGKGRWTARNICSNYEGRFLNPKSSKGLLGIDTNKKSETVILVEGVTDYITLRQMGFPNVVASLGAKVTQKDLYALKKKKVFVLFDDDYEGYAGAKLAAEYLREFNAIPIVLQFPESLELEYKRDISSVYVQHEDRLQDWLTEEIKKYDTIEESYTTIFDSGQKLKQYKSGIAGLDKVMNGGFVNGIHAIAGKPEMGKSSMSAFLAIKFAEAGARILYCTYELSKRQIWSRIASYYDPAVWSAIELDPSIVNDKTQERVNQLTKNIKVVDNYTSDQVIASMFNFDIIFVDYVQRVPTRGYDDNAQRTAIKTFTYEMSQITRTTDKLVFLLSSMPRSMYDKTNAQEVFKESGDIEYCVQSGLLLRPGLTSDSERIITVIKNTRGPKSDIITQTDLGHQLFFEGRYHG